MAGTLVFVAVGGVMSALNEAWRFFRGRRKWLASHWLNPVYHLFLEELVSQKLVDIELDDDLLRQGRVYDVIHQVNNLRKETGLELTDRIRLRIPDEELLGFADRIAEETLAVAVESGDELRLEKA